jgi:hypothetical protein
MCALLTCISLITLQGCASKRVLINPYKEPDPTNTNVARVRLTGAGTGYINATIYKNPTKTNCMKAKDGSDIEVFVMEFGKEKSTKLIGIPTLTAWHKRIGSEYYFKADEPVVISVDVGSSNTSYTGIGYSTSSYSCVVAAGFVPGDKKDYEMTFGLFNGKNGKPFCGALLNELIPDPKNDGKTIGVSLPVEKVALYDGSDEEVTSKCARSSP